MTRRKQCFQTQQGWCTYELPDCDSMRKTAQVQGRQNPSAEEGKWAQIPIPSQEGAGHCQLLEEETQLSSVG